MTDYNTMTAAQCADWLAERDGWTAFARHPDGSITAWINERYASCGVVLTHPMPLTLDAAAAALREPAFITAIRRVVTIANLRCDGSDVVYSWCVDLFTHFDASRKQIEGPDELTARYRAAVAARMEDDK